MEALHGVGEVPAYRGVVTAVTDNFDLTNFGNRIPNSRSRCSTLKPIRVAGDVSADYWGNLRASWSHVARTADRDSEPGHQPAVDL
jgi:hypothetical protein